MRLFSNKEIQDVVSRFIEYLGKNVNVFLKNSSFMNMTRKIGPQAIFAYGLPLVGLLIYQKRQNSSTGQKVARFLGIDKKNITQDAVFQKIISDPEYYSELHQNLIKSLMENDIYPLKKLLEINDEETLDVFKSLQEYVFQKEVLEKISQQIPSLQNVEKEIDSIKKSLSTMMESIQSPLKISNNPNDIIEFLNVDFDSNVPYISRDEDKILIDILEDPDKNIILITGPPGAGKSKFLEHAIIHCSKIGFTNFIFLKSFFREGDEKSLDFELAKRDNFVIIWDNLHERDLKYVKDVVRRITSLGHFKTFKFIGASRVSFLIPNVEEIQLQAFLNKKLIDECSKVFNVKLLTTPEKILSRGDATPYYVVSLFKTHKNDIISDETLRELPNNVIDLWYKYIVENIEDSKMDDNQINAFRTIGLLSCFSSIPGISFPTIRHFYSKIFGGNIGQLEIALDGLVQGSFISKSENNYFAHDSHIEALEKKYPLDDNLIHEFLDLETEIENLNEYETLANAKYDWNLLEKIAHRVLELDATSSDSLFYVGKACYNLGKLDEAMQYYDRVIDLNLSADDMALAFWGKAVIYFDDLRQPLKALDCIDKASQFTEDYREILDAKVEILLDLKRYDDLVNTYDEILSKQPNDIAALEGKGVSLQFLENYEDAIECFNQVLEKEPNHINSWYNKACCLSMLYKSNENIKYLNESIDCLEKSIRLNPENKKLAKDDDAFQHIIKQDSFKQIITGS